MAKAVGPALELGKQNVRVIHNNLTKMIKRRSSSKSKKSKGYYYDDGINTSDMVESKISGSTRMLGMPHQLLAHNDPRLGVGSDLGRMYAETFLVEAPTVCVKPGTVRFLPGKDSEEREAYLNAMIGDVSGRAGSKGQLLDVLDDDDTDSLQYYDHEGKFGSYMKAVNMLAQTMAILLGVDDIEVPWASGITFRDYDWSNYRLSSQYGYNDEYMDFEDDDGGWLENLANAAATWVESDDNYIQLYVDASASYSESVSNQTGASMLEGFTGQIESMAKEIGFILGSAGGSQEVQDLLAQGVSDLDAKVSEMSANADGGLGGWLGTFMTRLTSGAKQAVSGGNFILPEIWQDSSYDKNYSFAVTFATPYGSKLAWYINVGIGLCFVLGFVIPLQTSANTYRSPMILKCFSPGWWNCSLGICDSMGLEKGGDGGWTVYGLPNEIKCSLSIKELYSTLTLPSNMRDFMTNNGMMEFLMVNCGIDITNQKLSTKYRVWLNLLSNSLGNYVKATATDWMQGIHDSIRSKLVFF